MKFKRDLPPSVQRDVIDIIAKALLLRQGGNVRLSREEIHAAAELQCEYGMEAGIDGAIVFRIERQ